MEQELKPVLLRSYTMKISQENYLFIVAIVLIWLYFPGVVTVGEVLRNKSAFVEEVQQQVGFDLESLRLLMETTLPNNNFVVSQGHSQCSMYYYMQAII